LKILILIPTRNRSDLAQRAALSALAQQGAGASLQVVLSDNSDEPAEQQRLEAWARARAGAGYLRPPAPANMGDHWDWAIGEVLARFQPTHLVILTDRMVFRPGAVAEVAAIAQRQPELPVTFLHDRVNDLVTPVALERSRWSGAVCQLASAHLLGLTARCQFHSCVPRLLNAVTPVAVLARVRAAYGDYCRAVSPDFGFAYRCLATHDGIVYYDKALMLHYAISRSNGASATRGVLSKDAVNFRRATLGGQDRLPHAPYPELLTLGNFLIEEYGQAAAGLPARGLPAVDRQAYVKMLYRDIAATEDPATRAEMLERLARRGHGREIRARRLREGFKARTRWIEHGIKRLVRGEQRAPLPHIFGSVDEALAWDAGHPAPRLAAVGHLESLQPRVLDAPPVA
jgi:hypothetical protein